jgi:hypothetical protein
MSYAISSYAIWRRHFLARMGALGFGSLASPAATAGQTPLKMRILEDANQ